MTLDANRAKQILADSNMSVAELAMELQMEKWQLVDILQGKQKATRRQAESFLNLFGIWNVCWAMKDNWRWMPYAIDAIMHD